MNITIPRKNLVIKTQMLGGNFPVKTIKNINLTTSNIHHFLIENIPNDINKDKYSFKFSEDNTQYLELNVEDELLGKSILSQPRYLGKGGITAVYKIELSDQQTANYKIPDRYKNQLILRIFRNDYYSGLIGTEYNVGEIDANNDEQTSFINMWIKQKQLFPENIIDFYMYGEIKLNDKYLGFYTITKTYLDYNIIKKFDIITRIKYLKNMLVFLQKVIANKYTYRDFKFANIGAELVDGEYKFIVLDYDNYTIITEANFELIKRKFSVRFAVGTYIPYYIIEQEYNISYEYIFASGLLYTIIDIFFDDIRKNPNFTGYYLKYNEYVGTHNKEGINFLVYQFINALDEHNSVKMQFNKDLIMDYDSIKKKIEYIFTYTKYEKIDSPVNKLIYIIGKIMLGCISLNYGSIKHLISIDFPKFIIEFDDIISILDGSKKHEYFANGGYYEKYMKYKTKYINLKKSKKNL